MNKRSRKTKGLSHRLIALLLCCFCLLAAMPGGAVAFAADAASSVEESVAEQPAVVSSEPEVQEPEATAVPEATAEPTVEPTAAPAEPTAEPTVKSEADKLFDRLMACETEEALEAALNALTEEEQALMEQFTEEQETALQTKMNALSESSVATLEARTLEIKQGGSQSYTISRMLSDGFSYTCSPEANITAALTEGNRGNTTGYKISVGNDVPAGKKYTLTVHYKTRKGVASSEAKTDTIEITVKEKGKVAVHVYVSSHDSNGNSWQDNQEFQNLIGLYVCDKNGYFPAGTIYLDESYFDGKTNANTEGSGLINNANDWKTLLGLLSDMNNNNLSGTLGVDWASNNKTRDFVNNNGNKVKDYLSQAQPAYNQGWGSQQTALFRWHLSYDVNSSTESHLGHYGDTETQYHLDLCFNTNKITFICGNNGITQAISQDAYDGKEVDSRAYITGSLIQDPRNLRQHRIMQKSRKCDIIKL